MPYDPSPSYPHRPPPPPYPSYPHQPPPPPYPSYPHQPPPPPYPRPPHHPAPSPYDARPRPWQPAQPPHPHAGPAPEPAAHRAPRRDALGHHGDLRVLRSAYRWQRRTATLTARFPFTTTGLVSIPLGFACGWLGTMLSGRLKAEEQRRQ
ncbi:hypothetical protein ACIQ1J_12320 [Streptomyces sp. NPDC097107]|uniref:hypothetical protein n=1 Tax=Streptomyces sp. NPDC097107 TaxID=3366089 RepID=UPI00381841F2